MTGRDLIIYILQNNLEDREIIQDGCLIGFYSLEEYAKDMYVGIETIKALIKIGKIKSVEIGGKILIPYNFSNKLIKEDNKNENEFN